MELTSLCQYLSEDKQFYEPLKTGINAERSVCLRSTAPPGKLIHRALLSFIN